MSVATTPQPYNKNKRHYVIVMAFVVVLGCVGGGVTWYSLMGNNPAPLQEITTATTTYTRSAPVRLQIPALNIDTSFVPPLGLNEDQTVSVPDSYTEVGWYKHGATPGEIGPAVILGHVDSVDGPAVFYHLGQLEVGDEINVTRDDGTIAIFTVTKLERHPQSDFPTLSVYGPTDGAELRLVTCSGTFNRGEQRYSHNLVVYATLVE
jgi:sortase (surface protein transpeptidase)